MHEVVNKDDFARLLGTLRAHYPQRVGAEEWAPLIVAYHDALGHYAPAVLVAAVAEAWRIYRKWFPTAGELDELCAKHKRALAVSAPRLTAHEPKGGDEYQNRGLAELINRGASFKEIEEYCQEQMDAGLMAWEPGYSHPEHGRRKAS